MTPAEAILGITLHAARALRKEKEIGSLEPGTQADLVILDIPDHRHLSYHFRRQSRLEGDQKRQACLGKGFRKMTPTPVF